MACSMYLIETPDVTDNIVSKFFTANKSKENDHRMCLSAIGCSDLDMLDDFRDLLMDGVEFDVITDKTSALIQAGVCWDESHFDIFVYMRNTGDFVRVDKLTDRVLRPGNNIMRLYLSHEFC